jgi:hypothetical protein
MVAIRVVITVYHVNLMMNVIKDAESHLEKGAECLCCLPVVADFGVGFDPASAVPRISNHDGDGLGQHDYGSRYDTVSVLSLAILAPLVYARHE